MNTQSIKVAKYSVVVPTSSQWHVQWMRMITLVLLVVTISACTSASKKNEVPSQSYFKDPGSWNLKYRIDKPGNRKTETNRYLVTEFKDDGTPWSDNQLKDVYREIDAFMPKNILLYVHGWRNDASPENQLDPGGDMRELDGLLHSMIDSGAGNTLAIYVGWRGADSRTLCGSLRGFAERREAARAIGNSRAFRDFLGLVAEKGRAVKSNVVFVGHSLGAALLEKSAAAMIASVKPGDREPQRLPHLFILANSAELATVSEKSFACINSSPLVLDPANGTKLLSPRVLAVTSAKDWADLFGNPLHSYILLGTNAMTLGFDPRLWTHIAKTTSQKVEVTQDALWKTQYKLSQREVIDPTFWVPDSDERHLTLYRLYPRSGKVPLLGYLNMIMPLTAVEATKPVRTPGFWNIQIPAELSSNHNDIYKPKTLAAAVSWLRIANPVGKDYPNAMPALLSMLKTAIVQPEPDKPDWVRQLVMGAALRMPHNADNIQLLLNELWSLKKSDLKRNEDIKRYRSNIFFMLMFTHCADKSAWTCDNLNKLRSLMEDEPNRAALNADKKWRDDSDRHFNWTLDSFRRFLKEQHIRTS